MKTTHTMEYGSGGGTWYDGGDWHIKETPKQLVFTNTREAFFEPSHMQNVKTVRKEKDRKHCLRECNDEEIVLYPYQGGVPHVFTKLTNK